MTLGLLSLSGFTSEFSTVVKSQEIRRFGRRQLGRGIKKIAYFDHFFYNSSLETTITLKLPSREVVTALDTSGAEEVVEAFIGLDRLNEDLSFEWFDTETFVPNFWGDGEPLDNTDKCVVIESGIHNSARIVECSGSYFAFYCEREAM